MTTTPIADHWDQIERISGQELSDAQREVMRAMYFAGAMAAVHILSGWDPDADVQIVAVNHRSLAVLIRELASIYSDTEIELHQVQH